MFNPKIIDNFLSENDCNFLINTVNSVDLWESGGNECGPQAGMPN